MQCRTKIIRVAVESRFGDGLVDRQHNGKHPAAHSRNVDVDLLASAFEIGAAGGGIIAVMRATGLRTRFVDRATSVAQKYTGRFQSRALDVITTGECRAMDRSAGNHRLEGRRRKIQLNVMGRDEHFVRLHADGYMTAG